MKLGTLTLIGSLLYQILPVAPKRRDVIGIHEPEHIELQTAAPDRVAMERAAGMMGSGSGAAGDPFTSPVGWEAAADTAIRSRYAQIHGSRAYPVGAITFARI
jgi:hypothetical protein